MKLFISHAVVDKALALAFKQLVETVSLGLVNTWLSSSIDGLRPGDVLWNEVHQNLTTSDKIAALITPNSIHRPWILYESGYVAGNKKANVIPITFSIDRDELPLPLSAYVTYRGDEAEELKQLLIQIVGEIAPVPNTVAIQAGVDAFLKQSGPVMSDLAKAQESRKKAAIEGKKGEASRVLDKLKASELFHQRLADPNIRNITIITYTNEVESGSINHYRVKGTKRIRIFKRSILTDLFEQQQTNLRRVAAGSAAEMWAKHRKLCESTRTLEKEFENSSTVTIEHQFFDSFPQKRAYIFDDTEAIVSFFEVASDIHTHPRSIYTGMGDTHCIWVTRDTPFGAFVLDELKETTKALNRVSRSRAEEERILKEPWLGSGVLRCPCVNPKAVLVDLDGVLVDSMPYFANAWSEAFASVGITIAAHEPYLHESRSGTDTVLRVFENHNRPQPSANSIESIIAKRDKLMGEHDARPIMAGAHVLLQSIVETGFVPAIVTSSGKVGLADWIHEQFSAHVKREHIITGQDVVEKKPSPLPFLTAAARLGANPTECIAIENSPLGITSAARAGMITLAVNSGPLQPELLLEHGAAAVFQSTSQLAQRWPKIVTVLRNFE